MPLVWRHLLLASTLLAPLVSGCQCGGSATPEAAARGSSPLPLPFAGTSSSAAVPTGDETPDVERLNRAIEALTPLHADKAKPGSSDWLAHHNEDGQTFAEYRSAKPVVPDAHAGEGKRHALYIQPLGPLNTTQKKIVKLTARYMHRFFAVPVKLEPGLPLSLVPSAARRQQDGTEQILSSHVLDRVLLPRLPEDAVAYISFTASDLWPGAGWNFVFGQASLTDRVGVWSVHRYGNPDASPEAYRRALLRTLKVAVHETGHMLSIKHCTAHECVMGGSNNLDETDRAPVWLCPQCMAKMCWATRTDPTSRYRQLAQFAKKHGFESEATFFERSIAALDAL